MGKPVNGSRRSRWRSSSWRPVLVVENDEEALRVPSWRRSWRGAPEEDPPPPVVKRCHLARRSSSRRPLCRVPQKSTPSPPPRKRCCQQEETDLAVATPTGPDRTGPGSAGPASSTFCWPPLRAALLSPPVISSPLWPRLQPAGPPLGEPATQPGFERVPGFFQVRRPRSFTSPFMSEMWCHGGN